MRMWIHQLTTKKRKLSSDFSLDGNPAKRMREEFPESMEIPRIISEADYGRNLTEGARSGFYPVAPETRYRPDVGMEAELMHDASYGRHDGQGVVTRSRKRATSDLGEIRDGPAPVAIREVAD